MEHLRMNLKLLRKHKSYVGYGKKFTTGYSTGKVEPRHRLENPPCEHVEMGLGCMRIYMSAS